MESLFGAEAAQPENQAYRVLARKYRPHRFEDLIGQAPMVRTIANSFAAGRIHQAYIFTGVRGVGKTTTARILARGLNYETESVRAPSIDMPILGRHCQAIMDSRHVDVIEMDAASHTGIDNVRDLIESAQYKPVSARYKVFIIDEVHMLSNQAFNGLLKTLEEPPPHVKFLFATTEIRKVPVTVLSRCIRFDLRRIEAETLMRHLASICETEKVQAAPAALALIVRASEGSARDALSLLDQAIAFGGAEVKSENIRGMLGLADRARVIDLFEAVMQGDMPRALGEIRSQYEAGADPLAAMVDLADLVHLITVAKITPKALNEPSLSEAERTRGAEFARGLSMRVLSRAWQALLKAVQEVKESERPLQAAEMALVRLAHMADLPTPDEALRALEGGGAQGAGAPAPRPPSPRGTQALAVARPALSIASHEPQPAVPAAPVQPAIRLARFEDIVALAQEKRDVQLLDALKRDVRLVRFEDGLLEFALAHGGQRDLPNRLSRVLQDWTGRRWMVALSQEKGLPTLKEAEDARKAEEMRGVRADPVVRAVLERFPGAEIVAIRSNKPQAEDVSQPPEFLPAEPEGSDEEI